MLGDVLLFLLDFLLQPFATVLLLRFHLQWLRAPMTNPIGEFVMILTNFLVLRVRRFIPSVWKLDSASLLLAFIAELLYLIILLKLQGFPFQRAPLPGLLLLTLAKLLKTSIYLLMAAVLAEAILSWVNPYTPFAPFLTAITWRFVQPLRRVLPMAGNMDFSPLVLLLICQFVVSSPVQTLERIAVAMSGNL